MPRLRQKSKREDSKHDVEVLATLLVAYPQVSKATYDPEKKTLGMAFLCKSPLGKAKREALSQVYSDSIRVYHKLTGQSGPYLSSSWEKMERFHTFLVERDVATLTPGEINLTVDLVADRVPLVLASENPKYFDDNDEYSWSARLFMQEMLEQVRMLSSTKKLVALREGEHVLVFDK